MAKTILGIVVGYIVMAVFVFASFSVAFIVMGADRAYKPGVFDVTTMWIVVSLVLGFVAAMIGGFVCAAIAKRAKAAVILAVVVIVLGLGMAIPAMMAGDDSVPAVRAGDIGTMEAAQKAKQPTWVTLVNPFLGAVGVLIGGRRKSDQAAE